MHYGAGRSAILHAVVPATVGDNLCTLQIGGIYAHHLGMRHAELVKIELLNGMPVAESVLLVPASVDDWELIVSEDAIEKKHDNIAGIECRSNRRTASASGANCQYRYNTARMARQCMPVCKSRFVLCAVLC